MSPRPLRSLLGKFLSLVVVAVCAPSVPLAQASADGPTGEPAHAVTVAGQAPRRAHSTPVDVAVKEPDPERRIFAVEFNPLALLIDRLSANVELVPVDHHALVVNGYYFHSRTAQFVDATNTTFESQRFEGVGGEIGYRYYTARGGPRGFFVGPSFLAADVTATPHAGPQISFADVGLAVDIGWEALVVSRWVVSLGVGAEYVWTSRSLPEQQAPASYYAERALHPRALASIGCAF